MISGVGAAVFLWVVWLANVVLSFRQIDKSTGDAAILNTVVWFVCGLFWTGGCMMWTVKDGQPIEMIGLIPYIIGTVLTALLYDVVGISKKLVQFLGKVGP